MYKIKIKNFPVLQLAGRFSQNKNWDHDGRILKSNLLVYLEKGEATFKVAGKTFALNPNDVLFIPNNTHYKPYTQTGCTYLYFHFKGDVTQENAPAATHYRFCERLPENPLYLCIPPVFQAPSAHKLQQVLAHMTNGDLIQMNTCFLEALCLPYPQKAPWLLHIDRYIKENLQNEITLADLAKQAGYTKQYIIKQFKQEFQCTPVAYITKLRLQQAANLLVSTHKSITEIAELCGFCDSNYFARQFKKQFLKSPAIYRKQITYFL